LSRSGWVSAKMTLKGGGVCRPGQGRSVSTDYVTLNCGARSVSGEEDTLTINWRVRPEQCFDDDCGWNYAVEFVSDSGGLSDAGLVGWWRLLPAMDLGPGMPPPALPREGDLRQLGEEADAWQSQLGRQCPVQR
jgi:hypothetical protein